MSDQFSPTQKPVVACLDGRDDGDRAMRYAVQEAGRRGASLKLLHVPPEEFLRDSRLPLMQATDLVDVGSRMLAEAQEACLTMDPNLVVESVIARGSRVPAIAAASSDAACVVLGARQWRFFRSVGGSTSSGVAARATCPVMVVPPTCDASAVKGQVVVAVDTDGGPEPVLEAALDAARARNAELLIAHAWALPAWYQPSMTWAGPEEWQKGTLDSLRRSTYPLVEKYADVRVRFDVRWEVPENVIGELMETCDLLVLGRHREHVPRLHELGSLARHVLHAGRTPVEIVPVERRSA